MRKTTIVIAAAVLAVGGTSLSTSASAFGLVHLGGLGLVHPGFGLARPGFGLARPGFGPGRIGGGYGLGHLDGSFGGRRFGGAPYYGGYARGGYRGYGYRAVPLYGGYYGVQPYGGYTYDSGSSDGNTYSGERYDRN
jgi:hypothetical protein